MASKTPTHIYETGLMWFRRDLRTTDNAALHMALTNCKQVHCVFIFDRAILDELPSADRRVEFIHASVQELSERLRDASEQRRGRLIVRYALAEQEIVRLASELSANSVFANHDYEPNCIQRDDSVAHSLNKRSIQFHTAKDHVVFERDEVLTLAGKPFSVFTPYKNAWLKKLNPFFVKPYPSEAYLSRLAACPQQYAFPIPKLADMGFEQTNLASLKMPTGASGGLELFRSFDARMDLYAETRNFPGVKGPSYLGIHLRFGTVSIRQLVVAAFEKASAPSEGASVWLSELIWRDFYFQILANNPHVAVGAFKPAYDQIEWENGDTANELFNAWCAGQTGYPIVDAAMAQINQTGYMHNRLRMVVASFLTKDLGLDWRWGERYFAKHLNDFDLSANNGGWQWAASSGCDAQPYFRIFNPVSQSEKFDSKGKFIRRYLPELAALPDDALHAPWMAKPATLQSAGVILGKNYPYPIVDHSLARKKTLARYGVVKTRETDTNEQDVR